MAPPLEESEVEKPGDSLATDSRGFSCVDVTRAATARLLTASFARQRAVAIRAARRCALSAAARCLAAAAALGGGVITAEGGGGSNVVVGGGGGAGS